MIVQLGSLGMVLFESDEVAFMFLVVGSLTILTQIERIPKMRDEQPRAEEPGVLLDEIKVKETVGIITELVAEGSYEERSALSFLSGP
jgi:hypothetical protein